MRSLDERHYVGCSGEDLNDAKWTYAVKNSLVRFTVGDDIF